MRIVTWYLTAGSYLLIPFQPATQIRRPSFLITRLWISAAPTPWVRPGTLWRQVSSMSSGDCRFPGSKLEPPRDDDQQFNDGESLLIRWRHEESSFSVWNEAVQCHHM